MNLGIFAKTFSGHNLEAILTKVVAHRFSGIQFNLSCVGLPSLPQVVPDELIDTVARQIKDHRLEVYGISGTYNMIHPDLRLRSAGFTSFCEIARICPLLGTSMISLCTGSRNVKNKWEWHPDNSSKEAWKDFMDEIEKMIPIAEKYDLVLGIEPEAANVVQNPQKARQLLDELATSRVKIILDPANLFETGNRHMVNDRVKEAVDLLVGELYMAHAKDRTASGAIVPAGQGVVDFLFFIKELKSVNFKGPLVMHGLSEASVEASTIYLKTLI